MEKSTKVQKEKHQMKKSTKVQGKKHQIEEKYQSPREEAPNEEKYQSPREEAPNGEKYQSPKKEEAKNEGNLKLQKNVLIRKQKSGLKETCIGCLAPNRASSFGLWNFSLFGTSCFLDFGIFPYLAVFRLFGLWYFSLFGASLLFGLWYFSLFGAYNSFVIPKKARTFAA